MYNTICKAFFPRNPCIRSFNGFALCLGLGSMLLMLRGAVCVCFFFSPKKKKKKRTALLEASAISWHKLVTFCVAATSFWCKQIFQGNWREPLKVYPYW